MTRGSEIVKTHVDIDFILLVRIHGGVQTWRGSEVRLRLRRSGEGEREGGKSGQECQRGKVKIRQGVEEEIGREGSPTTIRAEGVEL